MVEELRKRLIKLDITAESIVGTTSLFFQQVSHQTKPGKLVDVWFEMLRHAASAQHLAYLYLSNDIIQHSYKNDGNQSLRDFGEVIERAFYYIHSVNPDLKVRGEVLRIIDIWIERSIYERGFLLNVKKKLRLFSERSFNKPKNPLTSQEPPMSESDLQLLNENIQKEEREFEVSLFNKYLMLNHTKVDKHLENLSDTYDLQRKWKNKCDFLSETLSKIVSNRSAYSEVDIECKLAEFKRAVQTEVVHRKQLVKNGPEALQKQENLLHQEYFMMKGMNEKIEELKKRLSLIKIQDPTNDEVMKEPEVMKESEVMKEPEVSS